MNLMGSSSRSFSNSNTSTNSFLDTQNKFQFGPQFELQDHHHETSFNMMNRSNPSSSTHPPTDNSMNTDFMRKYGGGSYDLADFDQAFLFLSEGPPTAVDPSASSILQEHQRQSSVSGGMRPPTLNIFPSQPMHDSTTKVSSSSRILSSSSSGSKRQSNNDIISDHPTTLTFAESPKTKCDGKKKGVGSSSGQDHPKTPDTKTMRRLAQNREAARKSRLRRKAYVQQLESSRIKLTQLEQELQKARAQGVFLGGVGGADQLGVGNISVEAAAFNMDYAKWVEDHRHRVCRLQAAVEQRLSDNEIRFCVDDCIAHFDDLMYRKNMVVKSDVFHIISGVWKTPAERCFMWIGGFRPSDLIQIISGQIEPLSDQQIVGIIGLRNIMVEAEERLSQELVQLNQSLMEAIISENLRSPKDIANYMGQMAAAMNKLSELQDIVAQADNLRHQMIHRVHELMTTRQASRSLMAISDYFHRLQSLSTPWVARERHP